jgi:hypothetical protein
MVDEVEYCKSASVTTGVGFTVIVKETGAPMQPFAVGVTVIVAILTVEVVFDAVNEGIHPLPFAPSPIDVLLFVQA